LPRVQTVLSDYLLFAHISRWIINIVLFI